MPHTDKDKVGSYAVTPHDLGGGARHHHRYHRHHPLPKSTTTQAQVAVMLHRYLTD